MTGYVLQLQVFLTSGSLLLHRPFAEWLTSNKRKQIPQGYITLTLRVVAFKILQIPRALCHFFCWAFSEDTSIPTELHASELVPHNLSESMEQEKLTIELTLWIWYDSWWQLLIGVNSFIKMQKRKVEGKIILTGIQILCS